MTRFRPCIDLHGGQVKQIVGSTLKDTGPGPDTNFVSDKDAAWFAETYRKDNLTGGHVIKLGPGNDEAAKSALKAYPKGLQIGGGITLDSAEEWLAAGASHVIVTSWVFDGGQLNMEKVQQLTQRVGREQLVLDLSCRRTEKGWNIATDRWQTITDWAITPETLSVLAEYCDEFLVHAADVEGKQAGMDLELIDLLARHSPIACTYAGGARTMEDLERVEQISHGRIDLTIGSALDIFGGNGVHYRDCVDWNRREK